MIFPHIVTSQLLIGCEDTLLAASGCSVWDYNIGVLHYDNDDDNSSKQDIYIVSDSINCFMTLYK